MMRRKQGQKAAALLLVIGLLVPCLCLSAAVVAEQPKQGDINGDGVVNSADARLLWRYLEQGYSLTEEQLSLADMSKNGLVNAVDARLLWQVMLSQDTATEDPSGDRYVEPSQNYDNPEPSSPDDYVFTTTEAPTTTTTVTTATTTTTAATSVTTMPTEPIATTTTAPSAGQPTAQVPPLPAAVTTPPAVTLSDSPVSESVYMNCIRVSAGGTVYDGSTKEGLQLAIAAVVKCEIGSSRFAVHSTEAWKAQAVVSYTHVARTCYDQVVHNGNTSYCFSVSVSPIDLNSSNDRHIYEAVGEVLGQKVMIPSAGSDFSKLCYGFYSASVAGSSSSCQKVYVANLPYAQSVFSPETDALVYKYTGQNNAYIRTYSYTMDELVGEVSYYLEEPVYYDTREDMFSLYTTEWDGGYMYRSNLYYYDRYGDKVYVKGTTLRAALGVRSHAISVIAETNGVMTVQVTGNGHGVGLSQLGAVIFANEYDWTYDQIIAHYFSMAPDSVYQLCRPKW